MQPRSESEYGSILFTGLVLAFAGSCSSQAADAPPRIPATVGEAAKVLDLGTLPLASGAKPPQRRLVATLEYAVPGELKTAFEFHRKQLTEAKWTELPGAYTAAEMATTMFSKDGFVVSLMVSPSSEAGMAGVRLMNLGNVDAAKLPVPPEAKSLYVGPTSAMFVTEVPVEATKDACRKLLLGQGWEPYGVAGDSLIFKQNAIRLNAFINAAPAQGGKTMITYSSELMSTDLPTPAEAEGAQYSDSTTQLMFDTKMSAKEVAAFYRKKLAQNGWKATTDNLLKIDFKDCLIFREPLKDLLELEMYEVEGKNRVILKYQTAAEIAELDRLVKAESARRKAEAAKKDAELNKPKPPMPKLAVSLPPEATNVEADASRIKFQVPMGKAKGVVLAWQKQFQQSGWKQDASALEDLAGALALSKGSQSLTVNYTDTGVSPAEITMDSIGVDLERADASK